MSRVIFKTIVSSLHELPFVLMNWDELSEIVDLFIICESNRTHTGEAQDFQFDKEEVWNQFPKSKKIRYSKIDMSECTQFWNGDSSLLHSNEQKIRDCFRFETEVRPDDIIISVDADEVLFKHRVNFLIQQLRRKILPKTSYAIRMHQIIFRLNYHWTDCKFRGPVICRGSAFLNEDEPQWRYKGSRTILKSGCHFSWVMTNKEIVAKILRYSHRAENEIFANEKIIDWAVKNQIYIFEPNRSFNIRKVKKLTDRIYPKSLPKYYTLIDC